MLTKVAELVKDKHALDAIDAVANDALLHVKAVRQGRTRGMPHKGDERIRGLAQFLALLGAEMTRQAVCLMREYESKHDEGAKQAQATRQRKLDMY